MKSLVRALAIGLVAAGVGVIVGRMLAPKPKPIPAEPLGRLKYGNEMFAKGKLLPPAVDEMTRYKLATEGQKPVAVVVSCSDARVPPEIIFNQGLGDLFVVRTAGNVVDEVGLASIEYAVEHLKVPLIVVLGHTQCGAVKAAIAGKPLEGHLPKLVEHIAPVLRRLRQTHPHLKGDSLEERAIQEHVRHVVQSIYERSAVVQKLYRLGKVEFAAGIYHLREGKVEWLKLPESLASHASKEATSSHECAPEKGH